MLTNLHYLLSMNLEIDTLNGNDGDNEFLSFFKGIKISAPNNVNGGLYYINLTNSFQELDYFIEILLVASEHDTLDFDFNINSNCAYYHAVNHDYSGTAVEDAVNQPLLGRNQFYIQTLGGVNGRITIPELDSLIGKNIIANKAEIILPFEDYFMTSIHLQQVYLFQEKIMMEIMSFYLIYLKEVKVVITML